jgi:hypothetical protein
MRALYALTTIEGRVADLLLEGTAMQDVSQKLTTTLEATSYGV